MIIIILSIVLLGCVFFSLLFLDLFLKAKKENNDLQKTLALLSEEVDSSRREFSELKIKLKEEVQARLLLFSSLKESEELYRQVFEMSGAALMVVNEDGRISLTNTHFEELFNVAKTKTIGTNWLQFIARNDRDRISKAYKKCHREKQLVFRHTCRIVTIKKQLRKASIQFGYVEKTKQVVIAIIDMTKQLEREDKFRQLFTAVEQSPTAVVITDTDGMIEYVNNKFEQVSGYVAREVLGKNSNLLRSNQFNEEFYADLWSVVKSQGVWKGELHNKRKDNTLYWEFVSISGIRDDEGKVTHYIELKEDITERKAIELDNELKTKELEEVNEKLKSEEQKLKVMLEDLQESHEELKQTRDQLVQSEKLASLGQLSAGIAHEINNPLGFIKSNVTTLSKYTNNILSFYEGFLKTKETFGVHNEADSELILALSELADKKKLGFIKENIDPMFVDIKDGINRIKVIVEDLKRFARQDEGTQELININEVLESVITIVWNELKYKVELIRDFSDVPPVKVSAQRIGQVFINLLINASHAVEKYGFITIKTYHKSGKVCVDVMDNGCGMDEETLKNIFDPFFTTKPVGEGTGLGLSLSYDIVKSYGGALDVESNPGKGTKFTVRLPI